MDLRYTGLTHKRLVFSSRGFISSPVTCRDRKAYVIAGYISRYDSTLRISVENQTGLWLQLASQTNDWFSRHVFHSSCYMS